MIRLSTVDAVLTANYAIYYENRKLWEAKGNVVVVKSDGKNLYTQQLFWNQQTKKIYSNVDSKIVQNDGRDVFIGEGFESDEEFKDWRFRRMKGRMEVEVKPTEQEVEVVPDSTAGGRTRGRRDPVPAQQSGQNRRCIRRRAYARTRCQARRRSGSGPAAVRRDAPGRPASAGEPAEARPRTEQQQMKPVDLKLDDDEIQSTQ